MSILADLFSTQFSNSSMWIYRFLFDCFPFLLSSTSSRFFFCDSLYYSDNGNSYPSCMPTWNQFGTEKRNVKVRSVQHPTNQPTNKQPTSSERTTTTTMAGFSLWKGFPNDICMTEKRNEDLAWLEESQLAGLNRAWCATRGHYWQKGFPVFGGGCSTCDIVGDDGCGMRRRGSGSCSRYCYIV